MRKPGGPTRREFLGTVGAAVAGAVGGPALADEVALDRPDVLLILVEDASASRFGCYGNRICRTPGVDAFAKTALRLDRAHTHPLCGPSRTAMLLGRHPQTTGVIGNLDDWRKTAPGSLTLPAHFRAHGYEAVRLGRIFFGLRGDWQDGPESWDRADTCGQGLPHAVSPRRAARGPGARLMGEAGLARLPPEDMPGLFLYGPSGLEDAEEQDAILASAAMQVLERPRTKGKPLFLAVGFSKAHLPFMAPDAYFDLYDPEAMVLPVGVDPDRTRRPEDPVGEREWREAIAASFACLSFVDAQVARVLAALESSGRAANTVVVVASDHGFMLGEHGRWRKGQLYDAATRLACLIRAPGISKPGSATVHPVDFLDLFPTLVSLAGLPLPAGLEGTSMVPLLEGPQPERWKRGALMETAGGRSIVTERWRYTEYHDPERGPQLFDQLRDPGETGNRVRRLPLAPVVEELRALLHGGWTACLPT